MINSLPHHLSSVILPRAIHSIPEINQQWPNWLYFCNLDDDTLKMMVLCCLDSFVAVKRDGKSEVNVEPDVKKLLAFLSRDFVPMNLICERAGMFEDRIEQRTRAIFEYFGLPFA